MTKEQQKIFDKIIVKETEKLKTKLKKAGMWHGQGFWFYINDQPIDKNYLLKMLKEPSYKRMIKKLLIT